MIVAPDLAIGEGAHRNPATAPARIRIILEIKLSKIIVAHHPAAPSRGHVLPPIEMTLVLSPWMDIPGHPPGRLLVGTVAPVPSPGPPGKMDALTVLGRMMVRIKTVWAAASAALRLRRQSVWE